MHDYDKDYLISRKANHIQEKTRINDVIYYRSIKTPTPDMIAPLY